MTSKKLRILHVVESYAPSIGGMAEAVRQISEGLVKQGHSVTVATSFHPGRSESIEGVKIEGFKISGNQVTGYRHGDVERYRQFLLNSDFDVVTLFAAQQWSCDLALPILKQIKGKKVFVPTGFSGLFDPIYRDYFEQMKSWLFDFDRLFMLSDDYRDVLFAREAGYKNLSLIPNGASETEFLNSLDKQACRKDLGLSPDEFVCLTVGSHTGVKGHKEAILMFDKAEIKNAHFLLVGNGKIGGCIHHCRRQESFFGILGPLVWGQGLKNAVISIIRNLLTRAPFKNIFAKKRLTLRDLSRSDTIKAYFAADVFLFPSNIECSPIVLFEAAAAGLPFLSSEAGNSIEIARWTGSGETIDGHSFRGTTYSNDEDGARKLERLYNDPQRRAEMGASGRKAWLERFTWQKVVETYNAEYSKICSE